MILVDEKTGTPVLDATVGSQTYEIKTIASGVNVKNAVSREIRATVEKGIVPTSILLFIRGTPDAREIFRGMKGRLAVDSLDRVDRVMLLFENGSAIELTRDEVLHGNEKEILRRIDPAGAG